MWPENESYEFRVFCWGWNMHKLVFHLKCRGFLSDKHMYVCHSLLISHLNSFLGILIGCAQDISTRVEWEFSHAGGGCLAWDAHTWGLGSSYILWCKLKYYLCTRKKKLCSLLLCKDCIHEHLQSTNRTCSESKPDKVKMIIFTFRSV